MASETLKVVSVGWTYRSTSLGSKQKQ